MDYEGGGIRVLPYILRIGANGSNVDNTSQGGIAIGFDLENVRQYGFFKLEYGLKVSVHPSSSICFNDFHIPYINQAISQAIHFHTFLQIYIQLGWVIAIGDDGPIFYRRK